MTDQRRHQDGLRERFVHAGPVTVNRKRVVRQISAADTEQLHALQ